jgi:hypothetical protein
MCMIYIWHFYGTTHDGLQEVDVSVVGPSEFLSTIRAFFSWLWTV